MNNLVSRPAHHDDNYDVARKVIEVFFWGGGGIISRVPLKDLQHFGETKH